ncbi:unnamed protein product, partial [Meganyctiphanes norvegica]
KKLMEVEAQKQQIEDDYLREKSTLLLEVASLKRNDNSSDLEDALKENEALKREKELLNNQLTESRELFNHMQLANIQVEGVCELVKKESDQWKKCTEEVVELQNQVGSEPTISKNVHQEILFENEALKQQVEALKKTLEDLESKDSINNENTEKVSDEKDKEMIEKYEEDLRNLQAKLSSASEDLSKKSAELEAMEQEKLLNAKLSTTVFDFESDKEKLEMDIKNLKNENDSLKIQLEELNKAAVGKSEGLNVQVQEITKQLDEAKNKSLVQETEFKNQIETLMKKMEDGENNKEELQKEKEALENEKEKFKEDVEKELQKEKDVLTNENEGIKEDLVKMQEENKSLTDKTKENDIFLQALKDNNKKLTSRIEELEEKSEIEVINEESVEKEAEIQSHKDKIAELFIEKTNLEDKYTSAKDTIDSVNKAIMEKDEVIAALNVKVGNLDSKLDREEEELSQLKQELDLQRSLGTDNNTTLDMDNYKDRCQVLEKEVAALREARQEETRELQKSIQELQDAQNDKEQEINTLQQELKKLIQNSNTTIPATPSTPSVQHIPLTPQIKPEKTDKDKEISALEHQVRHSESERMSLISEMTQLRSQLEESTKLRSQLEETQQRLSSLNIQDLVKPPQSTKKTYKKTVKLETDQYSDNEVFATPLKPPLKTPAKAARSNRKKDFVPTTPTESLHLALFPSEDEQTPAPGKNTASRGRPTRSSRSIYASRKSNKNSSFEYEPNSDSDKLTEEEEDLFGNDDEWAPTPEAPKPNSAATRKSRSTRTKSRKKKDDVYNPHLDQENKNKDKIPLLNKDKTKMVATQVLQETNNIVNPHINTKNSFSSMPTPAKGEDSQESDCDFQNKTSATGTKPLKHKRKLYKSNVDEPFECEPNMIELPVDSPHSVVRRQLRTKKK